jgi:hypothetical protein
MNGEQIFEINSIPEYSSYLHLLGNSPIEPEANFDLIIVPQGRSPESIERAAHLAGAVGSTLLSLCSHEAEADKVAGVLSNMKNGPFSWYAVDVPPGYAMPDFSLTAQQQIPDLCAKDPGWNLSDKRNIGMAIGRMIGARRIFFHDDDLLVTADALHQVGLMLHQRNIAGLKCGGFPDKSVLMHAKSEILAFQANDTDRTVGSGRGSVRVTAGQISANSMGVDPSRVVDHFPIIYNEDWLFAYQSIQQGLAGVARAIYKQDRYDPFTNKRIRGEEFGDLVIDGLYNRLNDQVRGKPIGDLTDTAYWQATIEARRRQYEALIRAVPARRNPEYLPYLMQRNPDYLVTMPEERQAVLQAVLAAGLEVNEALHGDQFVDYMYAWGDDQANWKRMIKGLPQDLTVDESLTRLDLAPYTLAA